MFKQQTFFFHSFSSQPSVIQIVHSIPYLFRVIYLFISNGSKNNINNATILTTTTTATRIKKNDCCRMSQYDF